MAGYNFNTHAQFSVEESLAESIFEHCVIFFAFFVIIFDGNVKMMDTCFSCFNACCSAAALHLYYIKTIVTS